MVRVEGHSLLPGKFDTDKMVYLVSNFEIGAPRSFFFDNRRCFDSSSSKTVQFVLPTDYYAFSNNRSASRSLLSSLASVMNISQSRMHIHVSSSDDLRINGNIYMLVGRQCSLERVFFKSTKMSIQWTSFGIDHPGFKKKTTWLTAA